MIVQGAPTSTAVHHPSRLSQASAIAIAFDGDKPPAKKFDT